MKAKPAATAETWAVFSPHCDQKSPHHGGKIIAGFVFFFLSELKPDSHESSKWCQTVSPEGDVILDSPSISLRSQSGSLIWPRRSIRISVDVF